MTLFVAQTIWREHFPPAVGIFQKSVWILEIARSDRKRRRWYVFIAIWSNAACICSILRAPWLHEMRAASDLTPCEKSQTAVQSEWELGRSSGLYVVCCFRRSQLRSAFLSCYSAEARRLPAAENQVFNKTIISNKVFMRHICYMLLIKFGLLLSMDVYKRRHCSSSGLQLIKLWLLRMLHLTGWSGCDCTPLTQVFLCCSKRMKQ